MAPSTTTAANAPAEPCPDPSAHSHASKLQAQASKAALYVTHGGNGGGGGSEAGGRDIEALGPDGKLSAAGAAASLKYAQAHELPSFPSVGIDTASSGNKAANLANANQKPFEHWKPELSASASKAALLANKKESFADGLWQPSASANGMSAAGMAMKGAHSVELDYGYTEEGRRRALLAATLSVNKKRDAAPPAPKPANYPDAKNSAFNALNAATVAHRPQMTDPLEGRMSSEANEMSRITHLQNVPREMFSEHPPLQIESEEQKRQAALRAATLSNQAKIEDTRRQLVEQQAAQAAMHTNVREQAKNYLTLQSEAQKLANERLAKLDPDSAAAFREHYGYGGQQQQTSPKHKLSLRGRRGNSDAAQDQDEDDSRKAGRIRHQTRNLHEQVLSLDEKKKQDDRAALQAAAERLVKARLSKMDDDVFQETGKASPAMMEEWERQARAKANANVEERMKHYGKVHIGGGKYMDQSEIDAIAAGRMQPTLDEITDTAEKQRARDEEIRLDQERRKQETAVEQQREKDKKDALKRQRDEEKAVEKAEKDAEKARRKEEKELEAVHKRLNKEEDKQLKEQRIQQDKAWIAEQQRADEEREAKAKAASPVPEASPEPETAAVATPAATAAEPETTATTAEPEQHTAVIKDMQTGEPKDVSTVQKQAPIAGLFSSKLFHGHDGPHPSKADTSEQGLASVASPATDAANAEQSTQDPPGVPTTFPSGEQPSDLVTSGRVPADSSGVAADTHFRSSKTDKRKSGLKGMFGKFKRNSRQGEGEAAATPAADTKGKAIAPAAAAPARDRSPSPSLSSSLPDSEDEREPAAGAATQTATVVDHTGKRRSLLSGVFGGGSKKSKAGEPAAGERQSRSRTVAPTEPAAAAEASTLTAVPATGNDAAASKSQSHSPVPVPGSRFAEEL